LTARNTTNAVTTARSTSIAPIIPENDRWYLPACSLTRPSSQARKTGDPRVYVNEHGVDMPEITEWLWMPSTHQDSAQT
jgi:hypothetical protein